MGKRYFQIALSSAVLPLVAQLAARWFIGPPPLVRPDPRMESGDLATDMLVRETNTFVGNVSAGSWGPPNELAWLGRSVLPIPSSCFHLTTLAAL